MIAILTTIKRAVWRVVAYGIPLHVYFYFGKSIICTLQKTLLVCVLIAMGLNKAHLSLVMVAVFLVTVCFIYLLFSVRIRHLAEKIAG